MKSPPGGIVPRAPTSGGRRPRELRCTASRGERSEVFRAGKSVTRCSFWKEVSISDGVLRTPTGFRPSQVERLVQAYPFSCQVTPCPSRGLLQLKKIPAFIIVANSGFPI